MGKKLVVGAAVLIIILYAFMLTFPAILYRFRPPDPPFIPSSQPYVPRDPYQDYFERFYYTSYPILSSLNATLVGAREYAGQIWSEMVEYRVDDPRIKPYMDWLRDVLSPTPQIRPYWHGDYIIVDVPVLKYRLFAENSTVKIGYVRLPFGYGVILTVYQDQSGWLKAVVHGTMLDEEGFKKLFARTLLIEVDPMRMQPEYTHLGLPRHAERNQTPSQENRIFKYVMYWALWRIMLTGKFRLALNETTWIPGDAVYILLEMPVLTHTYSPDAGREKPDPSSILPSAQLEFLYWTLSHPVFGMASNFGIISPEGLSVSVWNQGIYYSYTVLMTPLQLRLSRTTMCMGTATATAIILSALGVPSVMPRLSGHTVGAVVRLSSFGERGAVRLNEDYDFDGIPDSFDVLYDTLGESPEAVSKRLQGVIQFCPPVTCIPAIIEGIVPDYPLHGQVGAALSGVPRVVLNLPDWLKTNELLRNQHLAEKYLEMYLTNYDLLNHFFLRYHVFHIIVYAVDNETGELVVNVPAVFMGPTSTFNYLYISNHAEHGEEVVMWYINRKDIPPDLFVTPSSRFVKPVLEHVTLLYRDDRTPSFKEMMEKYVNWWREQSEADQRKLYEIYYKPYNATVVLYPVYEDVPVLFNYEVWFTSKSFQRLEGSFSLDENNYYVIQILPTVMYDFEKGELRRKFEIRLLWMGSYIDLDKFIDDIPANGTVFEIDLVNGRKLYLTVYIAPFTIDPDFGVVEIAETDLENTQNITYEIEGKTFVERLYTFQTTLPDGRRGYLVIKGYSVLYMEGHVGSYSLMLDLLVFGYPSASPPTPPYGVVVFPNGTVMNLTIISKSRVFTGIGGYEIYGSLNVGEETMHGATAIVEIPEINLTLKIKIPDK